MNIWSPLWILMAWCFSIRTSVATLLSMHPCISTSFLGQISRSVKKVERLVHITLTLHEHPHIWNHQFIQPHVQTNNKENTKALHYWLPVQGIHRWPMDSSHKGPVMQQAFPCHNVIMRSGVTLSMWNMRSSSHTFSKHLSKVSTNTCTKEQTIQIITLVKKVQANIYCFNHLETQTHLKTTTKHAGWCVSIMTSLHSWSHWKSFVFKASITSNL